MSLATRCTHCDTIFKVVQDQLKVSEGWVRCGRCNEVFNALEGLFDMEREAPPQRSRPSPPPPAVTALAAPTPVPDPVPAPDPTPAPMPSLAESLVTAPAIEAPPFSSEPEIYEVEEPPQEQVAAVTTFDLDLPPSHSSPMPAEPVWAPTMDPAVDTLPQPHPSPAEVAQTNATAVPAPATRFANTNAAALPTTEESDALDSRYLLTTEQAERPRRRRRRGPDFADAQFPTDLIDDADILDTDWGPSDLAPITEPGQPVASPASPTAAPEHTHASVGALLNNAAPDTVPTTQPSRFFEDEYQPEQPLPPPSKRKGRSGTRGRLPQPPAPEFIQQAERKAIWRHPVIRAILGVFALVLGLLLAGQTAHHWRDQLASEHPELKPWLAQWCELARCKLSPPMRLDDLQVDNITLVKTDSEGSDTYRMTVIIHSKSELPLAWPFVDITLTNPSGEVVARRAFDARTAQVIPASGEASSSPTAPTPAAVPPNASTTLQWQLRAPDLHLASYTAELFYP